MISIRWGFLFDDAADFSRQAALEVVGHERFADLRTKKCPARGRASGLMEVNAPESETAAFDDTMPRSGGLSFAKNHSS
jgi:hypothetical protein